MSLCPSCLLPTPYSLFFLVKSSTRPREPYLPHSAGNINFPKLADYFAIFASLKDEVLFMTNAIIPAVTTDADRPSSKAKTRETRNAAVTRCLNAWNYAFRRETAGLAETDSQHDAIETANDAYLRAMPPLCGLENICDFIACINFASRINLVSRNSAAQFMAQARVALAANSLHPKPQAAGAKSGGKTPASEI